MSYQPAAPLELFVRNRRTPTTVAELAPLEKKILERLFKGQDLARVLREGVADSPLDLEIATVIDDAGTPRYCLYGMNFGCVFLMEVDSLECIAYAAQHDLEHWHASQREVFWAMDRALRRNDHGFEQPMKFCWWDDSCWAEIADQPRGTVHSEPNIRQTFAGEN